MIRIIRGRYFYFTCFISFFLLVIVFTSRKSTELTTIRLDLSERFIQRKVEDDELIPATTAIPEALGAEPAQKEEEIQDEETRRSLTLRDILGCEDSYLDTRFEYYGNFVVFNNYVKASKEFRCHESITLSAPGDFRFLDNIEPLLDRWRGPVSVALYAPGYDFHSTIQSIAYLRQCKSELIKEYVTFHLFFEHNHFPDESEPLVTAYKDEFNCSEKPPYETVKDEDLYKAHNNLTYPINLARNIAKTNVQTHFVFPSDIELYPTKDFISKFMDMVMKNPQYVARDTRNVFVLPVFEVVEKVPESKTELITMLKNESAILFHKKMCAVCHRVPNDSGWEKAQITDDLNVFTSGKRHGQFSVWEPFFVCTQKEPLWDDRFNWEGQSNKMVQAYHLCMQDYNFLVLDNAFLTHKPGVKKKKVQVQKYQDQIGKNSRYLNQLSKELPKIYGDNANCKVRWQPSNRKKSKESNVHEFFKEQQERRQKMIENLGKDHVEVHEENAEKHAPEVHEKHEDERAPEKEEEKRDVLEKEIHEQENKEAQEVEEKPDSRFEKPSKEAELPEDPNKHQPDEDQHVEDANAQHEDQN